MVLHKKKDKISNSRRKNFIETKLLYKYQKTQTKNYQKQKMPA